MKAVNTYTCRSKNTPTIWVLRYNLEGQIQSFEVLGDSITNEQINWLFEKVNFPYNEKKVVQWIKDLKKHFEIVKQEFELTFENFYNLYNHKVGRKETETAWKKLSKKDRINAIMKLRHYDNYLKRNQGVAKLYPATYLNKARWESDYQSM